MQELPTDLATYISQMKFYQRMHKVKEREQHIQEVSVYIVGMVMLRLMQAATWQFACSIARCDSQQKCLFNQILT